MRPTRLRRRLLRTLGAAGLLVVPAAALLLRPTARAARSYAVSHTDQQWQALLSPEQYRVLRRAGTEPAYSSALDRQKEAGVFGCVGCTSALFSSSTKFDSGTGWPSFWKPLTGAVEQAEDRSFGIRRDEVLCSRCGGHLGHVFDDGPEPTGLRYCINGVALTFTPGRAPPA